MANDTIKCLMIGQTGIGKSTFLKNFPNAQLQSNENKMRETYAISAVNEKFETVNIEIENCDIALDTCLRDSDLIINNKVIPSNKIINTCNYKVIILSFAMDDLTSFELVKSKFEIEFKKKKKKKHSFILLGLKSDTLIPTATIKASLSINNPQEITNTSIVSSSTTENSVSSSTTDSAKKARVAFTKERSCSVNSNSSTSRLDNYSSAKSKKQKFKKRNHLESESDMSVAPIMPPASYYKKFAKSIGSSSFIQFSSIIDDINVCLSSNGSVSFSKKNSVNSKINAYDKLIKMIFKSNNQSTNAKSISKSISAPIDFNALVKFDSKSKTINDNLNNAIISEADNETYNLETEKSTTTTNTTNNNNNNNNGNNNGETNLVETNVTKKINNTTDSSVKTKLSRLFIGIGTYVVTCGGTHKSRRLAELKYLKKNNGEILVNNNESSKNNFDRSNKNIANLNRSFMRKKNSWLLLSSENSLNELDY